MKCIIKAKTIYGEKEIVENGSVLVEDGVIKEMNPAPAKWDEVMDFSQLSLAPGLIDIHIHGGGGYDTMDISYESLNALSRFKLREGVTAFYPTTVTSGLNKTVEAVKTIKQAMDRGTEGADIAGAFLEGPYISEKFKGAHPEEFIREVDVGEMARLIDAGEGSVAAFAIAPEKPGAMEAIEYLAGKGINVRIGHTAATSLVARAAVEKGASVAIHTFNAMSPFGHREAGATGEMLLNDKVYCELICDFVHVCKEAVSLLYQCKGAGKIVLITDCMSAGGLADGIYSLGEKTVIVKDGVARLPEGNLAGSTIGLFSAVKNIHSLGIALQQAIVMASENPARAMGIFSRRGSIAPGKKADFVVFNNDLEIKATIKDGKVVFKI